MNLSWKFQLNRNIQSWDFSATKSRTPWFAVLRKQAAKLKIAAERVKRVLKSVIFALVDWFVGSLLIPKKEMNKIVTNLKKYTFVSLREHLGKTASLSNFLRNFIYETENHHNCKKWIKTVRRPFYISNTAKKSIDLRIFNYKQRL